MPACIKAPLRAPASVCAGRCISGPGCMVQAPKIFRCPFFRGASKPGAAQPLQNSGACRGVAASQEEYAAAPGAACACRTIPERRLFSSRPSAAGGLLHPVPEAKAFYRLPPPDTPAACPQWEFCAPHNKMLHKKRRRKSAPALLSFRLFAPCFQCKGYSTSQQGYRKRAPHEDICLNAGFYSNSTKPN